MPPLTSVTVIAYNICSNETIMFNLWSYMPIIIKLSHVERTVTLRQSQPSDSALINGKIEVASKGKSVLSTLNYLCNHQHSAFYLECFLANEKCLKLSFRTTCFTRATTVCATIPTDTDLTK